jgi:hypothetical protein
MGRDYVSELRSPTDILFISQVIHEYGEPHLWKPYKESSSSKAGVTGEVNN